MESKDKKPLTSRQAVLDEIKKVNDAYKALVPQKEKLVKEIQKVDDEILKQVGAYKALKKVLDQLPKCCEKDGCNKDNCQGGAIEG